MERKPDIWPVKACTSWGTLDKKRLTIGVSYQLIMVNDQFAGQLLVAGTKSRACPVSIAGLMAAQLSPEKSTDTADHWNVVEH